MRKAVIYVLTAALGVSCFQTVPALALWEKQMQVGDVFENTESELWSVMEIVTSVADDGTYETQMVGDAIRESGDYQKTEFVSEEGDTLNVYSREEGSAPDLLSDAVGNTELIGTVIWVSSEAFADGIYEAEEVIAVGSNGTLVTQTQMFQISK